MLLLKLLGGQEHQIKFCRWCCIRGLLYETFSLLVLKVLIAKQVEKVACVLTHNELETSNGGGGGAVGGPTLQYL
ncbi:hypothetical protein SDJN02_21186 [Cucurbita argyrosperma subsp. argyrosperma]|nr:hypothetical protein SDJN02_21186 [Cucurbita argyrosperma subsp. argyrosperma]